MRANHLAPAFRGDVLALFEPVSQHAVLSIILSTRQAGRGQGGRLLLPLGVGSLLGGRVVYSHRVSGGWGLNEEEPFNLFCCLG